MKKRMRFAAMLAGAVLLSSAIPAAPVSALWWWGTASEGEFGEMQSPVISISTVPLMLPMLSCLRDSA